MTLPAFRSRGLGAEFSNLSHAHVAHREVESGHRHVIQQRLKLAGCWWKEPNAEAMLGLRVARANQLWNSYWNHPKPTLN